MTEEQKSKYEELQPLIEYATQKSGEINNALNDAQSLCDQKMYYEASQALDKISTDYKLPPTEQKKFDEEKKTAENGIKSVKITDALKNVETIYSGGDYDKATEELSKIDTSNLTDAQSQKYQSLQTNITNAKAAAEKAAAEAAAKKIAGAFGKGTQMGNKGTGTAGSGLEGSPTGNAAEGKSTGTGGYGTFDLNGRSLGSGGLPMPVYNVQDEGRVVVTITVNPAGQVISTSINKRTNTVNAALRKAAEEAARKARFNQVDGVNNQTGTITYYFKLK